MNHINKLLEENGFTVAEKEFIKNVAKEEGTSVIAQQQVIVTLIQAKATERLANEIKYSVSNLIINNSHNSDNINRSLKDMDSSAKSLAQGVERLQDRIGDFSNETTTLTTKANLLLLWYVGATIVIAVLTAINIYIQIKV